MSSPLGRKILLSITALVVAGSIAGLGTYATFTDTTSASNTIASGTVDINLGAEGPDNRLTVGATGMVPEDSLQRRVMLTNAGTEDLASITLTTGADPSSLLDTDATNGLQMKIETCGGLLGWAESLSTPYVYTCDAVTPGDDAGLRSDVLVRRAIIGADITLTGLTSTTAGETDDMVVTIDLPSGADNTFQGLSSTITYTFDAIQRDGTAK